MELALGDTKVRWTPAAARPIVMFGTGGVFDGAVRG